MKSFSDWRECSGDEKGHKKDQNGGLVPTDIKKAKHSDLITLPQAVEGTNCFNCTWVMDKEGEVRLCEHPDVQQDVNKWMCCKYWDNPKVKRSWGKMDS
jgi:hypothetical protein